jgi:nuclear cap-binding protein subunit 2
MMMSSVAVDDGSAFANAAEATNVSSTPPLIPILEIPRAPILQHVETTAKLYWDRSNYTSPAEQMQALQQSSTVYVGNLSFTVRSHHVQQHFTRLLSPSMGNTHCVVKRVILGLDRKKKTPCGFCFVEFWCRSDAVRAVSIVSGTYLDGKVMRVELDAGFQPGRQFGRGLSGGQVRTDMRIQQQQQNTQGKRGRSDEDFASSAPVSNPPVRLDAPLPSARNQWDRAREGEGDDIQPPSAKRMKMED